MKYKYINREKLINDIPYTIKYLENIERYLGFEIIIEETDHFYAPISLFYSQRIGNEQQIKDIENHLNSHCCICGSDEDVNTSKSREYEDYSMPLKFCGSCLAKQESPFHGLIYEIKKQTQYPSYTASHTKVRLKTEDGNFIYRFAEDIKFKDGHFVVRNDISLQDEIVKIVSHSIGLRDMNGERVYEGDILLAEDNNGRRFWGMVKIGKSGWDASNSPNPQWDNFMLCHGGGNFPSSLAFATKFKIIGTVGSIESFDGGEVSEGHYMAWLVGKEYTYFENIEL
jgi:hypothetical protein